MFTFRFEISELQPCRGLGHPKESWNRTDCAVNHAQLEYCEETKNIAGWADVVQFLIHPDVLNLVIDFLKTQQNSLGPNSAVYWIGFSCKFTLSDCLLLKSIIKEIIIVKTNVEKAIEQFDKNPTRTPRGVKNPDSDPALHTFRMNLVHSQIKVRSHCSYGLDPEKFHSDEDDHRRSIT